LPQHINYWLENTKRIKAYIEQRTKYK